MSMKLCNICCPYLIYKYLFLKYMFNQFYIKEKSLLSCLMYDILICLRKS